MEIKKHLKTKLICSVCDEPTLHDFKKYVFIGVKLSVTITELECGKCGEEYDRVLPL
jgi:transcription elongation factor Elf1